MALMLAKTYDALVAAGAPEDKARAAAEEIAGFDERLNRIDTKLSVIDTKLSVVIAGLLLVVGGVVKLIFDMPGPAP